MRRSLPKRARTGEHQGARMPIGARVVTRLVYFLVSVSISYLIRAFSALLLVHYQITIHRSSTLDALASILVATFHRVLRSPLGKSLPLSSVVLTAGRHLGASHLISTRGPRSGGSPVRLNGSCFRPA